MEGDTIHLCLSMPTISTEIADDVPSMDSNQLVSMPTISLEITEDVPAMDSVRLVSTPTTSTEITNDGPSMDSIQVESSTSKTEGKPMSLVESEIESSKSHWSEPYNDRMGASIQSNNEFYRLLQRKWGGCFFLFPHESVSSIEKIKKIAEGGQVEIYDVLHREFDRLYGLTRKKFFLVNYFCYLKNFLSSPHKDRKANYVLKVFKEGLSLQDMEKQWPRGMLENLGGFNPMSLGYSTQNCCSILGTTLLEDGRFAFVMPKYWGDLRKAINSRMQHKYYQPQPFTTVEVGHIVVKIAWGMWELHENNIVHGDLKASNVLVDSAPSLLGTIDPIWDTFDPNETQVKHWVVRVVDLECCVEVMGTTYWRAPEILQAVRDRKIEPHLFTKKVDVYGFAITCYEVLTGMMPFQDLNNDGTCYSRVIEGQIIEGQRPKLPEDINPLLRTLLNKCWHGYPSQRPNFKEITKSLREIYPSVYVPRKWVRISRPWINLYLTAYAWLCACCFPPFALCCAWLCAYAFLPIALCWAKLRMKRSHAPEPEGGHLESS